MGAEMRLLVNDALNQLGEVTLWNRLMEWFDMKFVAVPFNQTFGNRIVLPPIADTPNAASVDASLVIRNATYMPPIETSVPTISLLQDIIIDGPMREMQEAVIASSNITVFNSAFTRGQYGNMVGHVIPLPVDFSLFTPQNALTCQQALSLPDGAVCWIGASEGAAGHVKGFDIFMQVVRQNPDIPFVAVFKDSLPRAMPPNLRCYMRLPQADLVRVIGACRVGLCTSRSESQHLAGIEMGACGLPLVVPPVGVYWNRTNMGGRVVVEEQTPAAYAAAIRGIAKNWDVDSIRNYWRREFDIPVVRAQWEALVKEVENETI